MAHPVRQCSVAEKAVRSSELFQVAMNILPIRLYRYHCIPLWGICKQRREVLLRRMLRSMVGVHPGVCILICGVRSRHRGEEVRLRYGFVFPTGDPRTVAELAREVEEAGWDGAFYWDGICVGGMDTYDPWVVMAAMAMRTDRVRIGAVLTPPARRRPWKLARETVALDHLSNGRLVLPVGLGALDDGGFSKVGEPTDRKVRAQLLDESLEILTGLWSGEPFSYAGEHYPARGDVLLATSSPEATHPCMGGRSVAEQEVDGAGATLRRGACGHGWRERRIAGRYARYHPRDQGVRRGEQR